MPSHGTSFVRDAKDSAGARRRPRGAWRVRAEGATSSETEDYGGAVAIDGGGGAGRGYLMGPAGGPRAEEGGEKNGGNTKGPQPPTPPPPRPTPDASAPPRR